MAILKILVTGALSGLAIGCFLSTLSEGFQEKRPLSLLEIHITPLELQAIAKILSSMLPAMGSSCDRVQKLSLS